jgi:hypothetical protein
MGRRRTPDGAGKASVLDLDKVAATIRALRAKTIENGVTPGEAGSAARKAEEMAGRYAKAAAATLYMDV